MDPKVQASFIPKKSFDVGARPGGGGAGLLIIVALLIFIASIVSAGAAFLYQQYLTKSLADKKHSLELNEAAFAPDSINELLRTDSRINQAQTLMQKHVAVSAFFAYLSTQTLEQVSFSSFSYLLQADGSADIALNGVASSFSTMALQSDQFGASKVLKNIVFSGIGVDATGKVSFAVSAKVDPSVLNYGNSLSGIVSVPPATLPAASSTPITGSTTPN